MPLRSPDLRSALPLLDSVALLLQRSASVTPVCVHFFLLLLKDAPHGSGKDHGLHVRRYSTGIQHGVVARLASIELAEFSAKHIGTKDELLKRIRSAGWSVRADDSAPPENGTKKSIIVSLLD